MTVIQNGLSCEQQEAAWAGTLLLLLSTGRVGQSAPILAKDPSSLLNCHENHKSGCFFFKRQLCEKTLKSRSVDALTSQMASPSSGWPSVLHQVSGSNQAI